MNKKIFKYTILSKSYHKSHASFFHFTENLRFQSEKFRRVDKTVAQFFTIGIFAAGIFAVGFFGRMFFFAVRSIRRIEFSPYGIFAIRNTCRNASFQGFHGIFKLS